MFGWEIKWSHHRVVRECRFFGLDSSRVTSRGTKEEKEGKQQIPHHKPSPQNPQQIKKGLEELGHEKRLQAELQWFLEGQQVRPGLKQLRPEDLPPDVTAVRGYDHRGHCVMFVTLQIKSHRFYTLFRTKEGANEVAGPLLCRKKYRRECFLFGKEKDRLFNVFNGLTLARWVSPALIFVKVAATGIKCPGTTEQY